MEKTAKSLTAFITGGGGGIGKEIARELWSKGINIAIADIDVEAARQAIKEIDPRNGRSMALHLDVSKGNDVSKAIQRILSQFGSIDILINNAGISPRKENRRIKIGEIDEEEWDRVLAVNLKGVFNCSKIVMENMIKNKYGKIVNVASIAGIYGGITSNSGAHYAASKAGVIALTKTLAAELGPLGINVNAIAPGLIKGTGLSLRSSSDQLESIRKTLPVGRLGTVGDVAKLVAFLVSDAASFIAGETIVIDGGKIMS